MEQQRHQVRRARIEAGKITEAAQAAKPATEAAEAPGSRKPAAQPSIGGLFRVTHAGSTGSAEQAAIAKVNAEIGKGYHVETIGGNALRTWVQNKGIVEVNGGYWQNTLLSNDQQGFMKVRPYHCHPSLLVRHNGDRRVVDTQVVRATITVKGLNTAIPSFKLGIHYERGGAVSARAELLERHHKHRTRKRARQALHNDT